MERGLALPEETSSAARRELPGRAFSSRHGRKATVSEEVGAEGRGQTVWGLGGRGGVGLHPNTLGSYEGFLRGKNDQIWTRCGDPRERQQRRSTGNLGPSALKGPREAVSPRAARSTHTRYLWRKSDSRRALVGLQPIQISCHC